MGRGLLHREQLVDRHRQGKLFRKWRWHADADPQGPGTTGSAILQANAEVTRRRVVATRDSFAITLPWAFPESHGSVAESPGKCRRSGEIRSPPCSPAA